MRRSLLLLAALLALAASHASAWNTETQEETLGWRSVYLGNARANSLPVSGWTKNEHTELSHVALAELGVADCFGIDPDGGGCGMTVVDLNASLYQQAVFVAAREGDDPSTPLEERWVPPPAYFAGLPDYSWALHDWINKNTLCPPLPPDAANRDGCYRFFGWLGVLNSNHFGTQARAMYRRYHSIALDLARRAREMRAKLAAGRFPADRDAYADFVREAELEALVFESVGQHFLQDRWSSGHMWERWNGPDHPTTRQLPYGHNLLVAMASGLLHGSEGITKLPDPMCSPAIRRGLIGSDAEPVRWRLPGGLPLPGVGDYRLEDMHDGFFGFGFGIGDLPIDVTRQRARMFACSKAGWSEVIRAFGEREPGRFGQFGVALAGDAFPPVLDDASCWEAWATNAAIAAGWLEHPALRDIDVQARALAVAETAVIAELRQRLAPLIEANFVIVGSTLLDDPDGTTLAQGALGPVAGVRPGNAYAVDAGGKAYVPDYTEPESLDALPARDPQLRGQDKHAIYGFWNRAHADWWCADLRDTLDGLRGAPDPVGQAACAYLADRAYKATDPAYRGRRSERRMLGDSEIDPICRYHGVETAGVDDALPYHLHPGYVAAPGARGRHAYDSIAAWCRAVPVVDAAPCPGETPPAEDDDAWDVVGRVAEAGGVVVLRGRSFGEAVGEVWAGSAEGGPYPVRVPVTAWNETEIRLEVPSNLLPDGDWFLQVRPPGDPARWSVGRFILRVGEPCAVQHPLVGSWILSTRTNPPESRGLFHFLPDGAVMVDSTYPQWLRIATWSASGNTVTVEPCPSGGDDVREAPRFAGTWSAHPVSEGFGVTSCFGADADACPAMQGDLVLVFEPFGRDVSKGVVDTRAIPGVGRGYFRLRSTPLKDFSCHGACRERWSYLFPHQCARDRQSCAEAAACGGRCPDGFACGAADGGCRCAEE